MSQQIIYEASAEQLIAVQRMSNERALAVSAQLAEVFVPLRVYYPNNGSNHSDLRLANEATLDIGRTAHELAVHITDEPQHNRQYMIGPHCLGGEQLLRGIALWGRQRVEEAVPSRQFGFLKA